MRGDATVWDASYNVQLGNRLCIINSMWIKFVRMLFILSHRHRLHGLDTGEFLIVRNETWHIAWHDEWTCTIFNICGILFVTVFDIYFSHGICLALLRSASPLLDVFVRYFSAMRPISLEQPIGILHSLTICFQMGGEGWRWRGCSSDVYRLNRST